MSKLFIPQNYLIAASAVALLLAITAKTVSHEFLFRTYIDQIIESMSDEEKIHIVSIPKELLGALHLTIGVGIRNRFIYRHDSFPLRARMYLIGITNPDEMSRVLIHLVSDEVYRRLSLQEKDAVDESRSVSISLYKHLTLIDAECVKQYEDSIELLKHCVRIKATSDVNPYFFERLNVGADGIVIGVDYPVGLDASEQECLSKTIKTFSFPSTGLYKSVFVSAYCTTNKLGEDATFE